MTRHNLKLCTTKELSSYIKRHNVKTIPEQINMAWGLDNDGYFLQLWFYDHDSHDDIYIEDGLMGESKNHILAKMEKYNIIDEVRRLEPNKLRMLCLDEPF